MAPTKKTTSVVEETTPPTPPPPTPTPTPVQEDDIQVTETTEEPDTSVPSDVGNAMSVSNTLETSTFMMSSLSVIHRSISYNTCTVRSTTMSTVFVLDNS